MRSRAIVQAYHKYTLFGGEYYEPILDFQIKTLGKYKDEYDKVYFMDSNWEIDKSKLGNLNAEIIRISPNLRYYDGYKEVLPQVKEDLVLFMDNDVVVYKDKIIDTTFSIVEAGEHTGILRFPQVDVVSICASIGNQHFPEIGGNSQFSLHWFATHKDYLMKYIDLEWGPNMPEHETFGAVTKAMIEDKVRHFEIEEDMTNILYNGTKDRDKGKDLGHYHIRAGATPAYLLATKYSPEHEKTYWEYIKNQPKSEYLRQCAWYYYMMPKIPEYSRPFMEMLTDMGIDPLGGTWIDYLRNFIKYHGL